MRKIAYFPDVLKVPRVVSDCQTMNYELQKLKMRYIPMFARGKISERECARLIGIQPVSVWRLKMRWLKFGDAIWIHGNTGRKPKNKKYDWEKIAAEKAFLIYN